MSSAAISNTAARSGAGALSGARGSPNPAARQRRYFSSASRRLREVCLDAQSTAELIDGLREPLNDALGLSGLLLSATDPQTTALGTATVVEHLPPAIAGPWMQNEHMEDDFNKFAELHQSGSAATTLNRATQGRLDLSPRHRELHRPHGLGHELRTTFSQSKACWGVANLVREAGDEDFDARELSWLEELRPEIAAGIQRTTRAVAQQEEGAGEGPGVVNLDAAGTVLSMTADATAMLADLWLCPLGEDPLVSLPGEAYMVTTLARARAKDPTRIPRPVARLQGQSGRWLTIRGDCSLTAEGELAGIVLIIERSRPADILPLAVAAYGLTPREQEVLGELSSGRTTAEVAARLFISEYTVSDHVKAILAKTRTASRGELISLLFQEKRDPIG